MENIHLSLWKAFSFYASQTLRNVILILMICSCENTVLQETSSGTSSIARLSGEPLFLTSYEIEEFSATQIISKLSESSKDKPFIEIAAQPRLYRQKVDFKLFRDGNYEIVTTQLKPTRLDLLPSSLQKKTMESVLSYKTVVQNGIAHFYDRDGNETGKSQLKMTKFASLADKILKSAELNKGQIANEIMGHPLINETYVLGFAREKNAEINVHGAITEIKFDLSRFTEESNEQVENLSKYSVQYYDFKNKRLLGEQLYDKEGDKLLYRSNFYYSPAAKGNQIEKIMSDSFDEDPKTGIKTRKMKQIFYSYMKADVNI